MYKIENKSASGKLRKRARRRPCRVFLLHRSNLLENTKNNSDSSLPKFCSLCEDRGNRKERFVDQVVDPEVLAKGFGSLPDDSCFILLSPENIVVAVVPAVPQHRGKVSSVVYDGLLYVQRRSDIPPETDDSTVDENGQKVQTKGTTKASYKSTLMGSSSTPTQLDKIEDIFELHDGHVITEVVDGIPSIKFSE
ncbi:hypothetical protein Gotur_029197 [Gossypium turneri]